MKTTRAELAPSEDTVDMENRNKGEKAEGKKASRREKRSKRQKCDKEKMFKILETKVSLSKEEIRSSYEEFMAQCPSGEMTKSQFMKDQEGLMMAESLFREGVKNLGGGDIYIFPFLSEVGLSKIFYFGPKIIISLLTPTQIVFDPVFY